MAIKPISEISAFTKTKLYSIYIILCLFTFSPAVGFAHLGDGEDSSVVHACTHDHNNTVKIVGSTGTCASNSTPIHWSIVGPPGPINSELLGRISSLELQVQGLQQQIAELIPPPPPNMSINDVTLDEGADFIFTVSLSAPSTNLVGVDYSIIHGTTNSNDISEVSGALLFNPGTIVETIVITSTNDTQPEIDDTFSLVLENEFNAVLTKGIGVGIVANDDTPNVFVRSDINHQLESAGIISFQVTLDKAHEKVVSAEFITQDIFTPAEGGATGDSDYQATSELLTFLPGEVGPKTVEVLLYDDNIIEGTQAFLATLINITNTNIGGSVTGYIYDDDVSISMVPVSVNEGDTTGIMTLELPTQTESRVFFYAVPDPLSTADYTHVQEFCIFGSCTRSIVGDYDIDGFVSSDCLSAHLIPENRRRCPRITIDAGQQSIDIQFNITEDSRIEGNETFKLLYYDSSVLELLVGNGEGTIVDND